MYTASELGYHCPCRLLFLHNRPWILPWIKSISNELDIIIHVIASQLSGRCDVISNRLWRHQQSVNRASEAQVRCVKIIVSSSFMDSLCRVRYEITYVFSWRTVYALTRVFSGVYSPCCCATREINTPITLSWAHKQFATRGHTLIYIHSQMPRHQQCCWVRELPR